MRPIAVTKDDEDKIFKKMYGVSSMRELLFKRSKTKLKVGATFGAGHHIDGWCRDKWMRYTLCGTEVLGFF